MDAMQHQMMGYDRAITMFSPDGRLLQVEYAKKTVKQGSAAIAMACKDGVLFVTDKRIFDPLIITKSVDKIWQIDNHIGVCASGILSDARVLVERSQITAQQHKVNYDSPIDTLSIVKDVCDLKQMTTQSGGLRPFGVSLLIGGIDDAGPRVYLTDPTGIYFQYGAVAIGERDTEMQQLLHKKYKPSLKIDEALKVAIEILKEVLEEKFDVETLDAAYIKIDEKKFTKVSNDKLR